MDRHGVRLSVEAKHPTKPGHVEGDGADVDHVLLLVLVAAVHEKGLVFQAGRPPRAALQHARKRGRSCGVELRWFDSVLMQTWDRVWCRTTRTFKEQQTTRALHHKRNKGVARYK